MELKKAAVAGTLESSDALVTIEPGDEGIQLTLESSVINQYGKQLKSVILETLHDLEVENAFIKVVDKGALDCIIKARVQTAIFRSANKMKDFLGEGLLDNEAK